MTDPINSNNRIQPPAASLDKRTGAPAREATNASSNPSAAAVVELSSEQIMKQMEGLPEVNNDRVEAIKNALANGDYKPDPELIARKFSEIEELLP